MMRSVIVKSPPQVDDEAISTACKSEIARADFVQARNDIYILHFYMLFLRFARGQV